MTRCLRSLVLTNLLTLFIKSLSTAGMISIYRKDFKNLQLQKRFVIILLTQLKDGMSSTQECRRTPEDSDSNLYNEQAVSFFV